MSKFKVGDRVQVRPDAHYASKLGTFNGYSAMGRTVFVELDVVPGNTTFLPSEIELFVVDTPKPHKHAELIKAWADNPSLVFQWKHKAGFWTDWVGNAPDWSYSEIRIKPTPKPDRIETRFLAYDTKDNFVFPKDGVKPNVKFVFDGDTGKLKAVEILA